ncbi:EscU/YscU/HrcU family type III secretion system export apparatus switch protein [uncultured Tateyamaria sp.]|uniref:EscU/YscU/HrcU family type III secretion system export apparatus switch protein n=1 Tax=uncultured Tateyamaria sp. TaxID=455651 RepID=UPI00260A1B19|nr:EscU/YscU/HrcU family type III secretion system export apparatus switch protein [uncultured Tateyamaria sp.]
MSGEKTEKPTEKKIDQAREKGNVAERKNALEAMIIIGTSVFIISMAGSVASDLVRFFDNTIESLHRPFEEVSIQVALEARSVISIVFVVAMANGLLALFITLLLNKFNFSPQSLSPKFEKFNPISGLKNIFSLKTLYNFFRILILLITITALSFAVVRYNFIDVVAASFCGLPCFADVFLYLLKSLCYGVCAVLFILSVLDFKIQNALYTKQNKMSKDDVKREQKDANGNPEIKAERQSIAHRNMNGPALSSATHVIHSDDGMIVLHRDPDEPDLPPYVLLKTKTMRPDLVQKLSGGGAKVVQSSSLVSGMFKKAKVDNFVDAGMAKYIVELYKTTGEL